MSGIRIRHPHPDARNTTLRLVSDRPMRGGHDCPQCHAHHTHKTYHLVLDDTGATIVSEGVLEALKRFPNMAGFIIESEVKEPPPQRLVVGGPVKADRPAIVDLTELQRGR